MLDAIRDAWGWLGIDTAGIVAQSKFGNIIFRNKRGQYWRLCPEELSCQMIAKSEPEYLRLSNTPDFLSDWNMTPLVEAAETKYGIQPAGSCFCLKIPGTLGGAYELENIGTISVSELVRFSGYVAQQIKDLPDGASVELRFVE